MCMEWTIGKLLSHLGAFISKFTVEYDIEKLPTDYSRLQVHKNSPGNMLASSSLTEEGVEGVVSTTNGLVTGHLAIWLDSVLQAVQFPAGITDLDTSLADMNGDTLTLKKIHQSMNNDMPVHDVVVVFIRFHLLVKRAPEPKRLQPKQPQPKRAADLNGH